MRKLLPILMAATALVLAVSVPAASSKPQAQLKVALIAPSAHNDLAFTQSMYHALQNMEKKYDLELSVSENQFVVANAANIMRQYASQGYDLIIAHGSQYGGTVQQLAPQFPKTSFAWGTAGTTYGLSNVYAYEAASEQGGYVNGYVASLMSKSKVLGVIGPIAVGDAKLYVDGFVAGAKAQSRKTVANVAYTGSFSDPSLMAKQAEQFVAQKADVLTGSSQSVVGAINVARQNNLKWFGTQWTQASLAPKNVIATQMYDWMVVLNKIIPRVQSGKLGGVSYRITLKNGGEKIQFNNAAKAPKKVREAAKKVIARIVSGKLVVPTAP
ncbi:MAG TPA: BMP family protein [Gaiellaceae bacterium]|nr:BMP family protein [Gaiellaceae bacterium]